MGFSVNTRLSCTALVFGLVFCSLGSTSGRIANEKLVLKRSCAGSCLLSYRCDPYYESLIWTIVDGVCKVYRNGCVMGSANCMRRNNCQSDMVPATKEECQQHCSSACDSQPQTPVCAFFPKSDRTSESLTFGNQCELDKMACLNGKAYVSANEGACS